MGDRLLILGASARAAAASARRAGLEPFAIDLFADRDTQLLCDCLRCPPDEYPEGLFRLARQAPPMPWMYTGGLENYPELVGELAKERELWGNGPDVLNKVRDPFELARWCADLGFTFPQTIAAGERPPGWTLLRKSYRSASGMGVRYAAPTETEYVAAPGEGYYLQAYVDGAPMSAVFESTHDGSELIGHTQQLIGVPWLHSKGFRYCGNLRMHSVPREPFLRHRLERLAFGLQQSFGLRGIWGLDFIQTPTGPVLHEVNPRYPASVEVIELSIGVPAMLAMLPRHMQELSRPAQQDWADAPHHRIDGKAIYYAPRRIIFPESGPWDDSLARCGDVWYGTDYADVPHPGDVIEAGHPVLTIFAEAECETECLRRLQSRAAELDRLFGVTP